MTAMTGMEGTKVETNEFDDNDRGGGGDVERDREVWRAVTLVAV